MPYSYDNVIDITFATLDFVMWALTMPVRALFPNVPGIRANSPSTLGKGWGESDMGGPNQKSLESYGTWFWLILIALVVAFI